MRGRYGQLRDRKRPELGCWVMNSVHGYHTEGTAAVLTQGKKRQERKGVSLMGRALGKGHLVIHPPCLRYECTQMHER